MNAPEGLAEAPSPYRFTWDEVLRMAETGIIDPDARVELIEGELIQMSPQSVPHARFVRWLSQYFARRLAEGVWEVSPQCPAVLDIHNVPEPDIYIFPSSVDDRNMKGSDIALAIEVAVSSLAYDLGRKARLYAKHGVQEYWVIDVERRRVTVHRHPGKDGYAATETLAAPAELRPLALPEIALAIAELPSGD
jgi:Uma2 family endonuclease